MPPSLAPHLPRELVAASRHHETSTRTETIETLAIILEAKRVVHVRGTPSSGETALAHLLLQHYEDRGEPVNLIDRWHNILNPTAYLVFLFEESQQSYQDSRLWLGIIKTQVTTFVQLQMGTLARSLLY